MRSQLFIRAGLLLILLALLLPAMDHAMDLATEDQLNSWTGRLFQIALGSFGLSVVLAFFEKLGVRVSGARCQDCRKKIAHGHAYCFDHLMTRRERAQARLHGRNGIGI